MGARSDYTLAQAIAMVNLLATSWTTLYEQIRDHGLDHISISLRDLGDFSAGSVGAPIFLVG